MLAGKVLLGATIVAMLLMMPLMIMGLWPGVSEKKTNGVASTHVLSLLILNETKHVINVALLNATGGEVFTNKKAISPSASDMSGSYSCAYDPQGQIYWATLNGNALYGIGAFQGNLIGANSLNGLYAIPLCWNPRVRDLTTLGLGPDLSQGEILRVNTLVISTGRIIPGSTYTLPGSPAIRSSQLGRTCAVDDGGTVYSEFSASSSAQSWPSSLYAFDVSSPSATGTLVAPDASSLIYGLCAATTDDLGPLLVYAVAGQTSLDVRIFPTGSTGSVTNTTLRNVAPGFGIRYKLSSATAQGLGYVDSIASTFMMLLVDQFKLGGDDFVLLSVDLVQHTSTLVPLQLSSAVWKALGVAMASF
jgi:hypothetical protein